MDGTLIILVLLVLMYLVLFLPRQRQAARQRAMQSALAAGDRIVTIGGIHGVVASIEDEAVLVEVSPGVEVRLVREAIASRLAEDRVAESPEDAASDTRESTDDGSTDDEGTAGS